MKAQGGSGEAASQESLGRSLRSPRKMATLNGYALKVRFNPLIPG
jgi:hypothetical protein